MIPLSIPQWTAQGVLPPINSAIPTTTDRSPYEVSLTDVVLRYATSPERNAIFEGFLRYRAALHAAGLDKGFQWIDGSFLENIELIEKRAPRDMDVVTFSHLQSGQTQADLLRDSPRLFNPVFAKVDYHVDAYFVQLNSDVPEPLVSQSTYWYSLWSHRRDGQWKGYLQIDLSPAHDPIAKANLDRKMSKGDQS
jgi:hypothetical protein